MSWIVRVVTPILSVLLLWYLSIWFSGLPAFVIPRPERVIEVLWVDRAFIFEHLLATLQVAAIGFLWANVVGIGMAVLFTAIFSAMSVVWDREIGFMLEIPVAPISRAAGALGKALGRATQANIQGLVKPDRAPTHGGDRIGNAVHAHIHYHRYRFDHR